jgi:CRP-like cAMP-binding protein
MNIGALGKVYEDGEHIIEQGEAGDCMYVVQQGEVEVVLENPDGEIPLSVLKRGDVFGEMSLFTKQPRSATVRARGKARVLTVDKRGFLKRVHEDPSLAFRILQKMSERIRSLNQELIRLRESGGT